jgi:hypothetical protein
MTEPEIIDLAFNNISPLLNHRGKWENHDHSELDGFVILEFSDGILKFPTEVKYEVRAHLLGKLKERKDEHPDFLIVAYRIYPNYRQLLQEMGINYLEANGNAFIHKNGKFILIDKFPPLKSIGNDNNRAFTKTGLRVFFQLLIDNTNLFVSQRELAEKSGVALGNIPLVIKGLKAIGLLLKRNDFNYQWSNKEEAIGQWVNGYRNTLKTALFQGKYRLPNQQDWRDINLPTEKTLWGGEPGADLLTNYLRPERLTLFTDLKRNDLIKALRLMPDPTGEIEVYETFWKIGNEVEKFVPPLLVYADLVINGDKRSLETARIIYDKYLTEL